MAHFLGEFELNDIEMAKKGVPKIEVTFNIDANGILKIDALNASSNKIATLIITNDKGRLSRDDIEKMLNDSENFKKEDLEIILKSSSINQCNSISFKPITVKSILLETSNDMKEFFRVNLYEMLTPLNESRIMKLLFEEYKTEETYFKFDSNVLFKLLKLDLRPIADYLKNCGLKSLGIINEKNLNFIFCKKNKFLFIR